MNLSQGLPWNEHSLRRPAHEFLTRPSKRFRESLVFLGARFALQGRKLTLAQEQLCAQAAQAVENIHAGSLIIDDIQDGSVVRRGDATLHRQHGVPVALNVGNWLYFAALEGIAAWGLPPDLELRAYRLALNLLVAAHEGQAIDVGTDMSTVPRSEVAEVCLASARLKTGALTSLAMAMGAVVVAGAKEDQALLVEVGSAFGVALQRFDDLGNFYGRALLEGKSDPKRFEDLRLRRPGWIWACAAALGDSSYDRFRSAVQALPNEELLLAWLATSANVAEWKATGEWELDQALVPLETSPLGFAEVAGDLEKLVRRLKESYV